MAQSVPAIFSHGLQEMIDHTPAGAVAAGDVLNFGTGTNRLAAVADVAIAASELGAISIRGIYKLAKKTNVTFTVGQSVEWDISAELAVDNGDGNGDFAIGLAVAAAAASDEFVLTVINFGLAEPAEGSSG